MSAPATLTRPRWRASIASGTRWRKAAPGESATFARRRCSETMPPPHRTSTRRPTMSAPMPSRRLRAVRCTAVGYGVYAGAPSRPAGITPAMGEAIAAACGSTSSPAESPCRCIGDRSGAVLALALPIAACMTSRCRSTPRPESRRLAPTGKLRAAINYGNPVLASKDPVDRQSRAACRSTCRANSRGGSVFRSSSSRTTPPARSPTTRRPARGTSPSSRSTRSARPTSTIRPRTSLIEGAFVVPQGLADPRERRRRPRGRARRGGEGQRLRPLPLARAHQGDDRACRDVAGGRRGDGRARLEAGAGVKQQLEASAARSADVRCSTDASW